MTVVTEKVNSVGCRASFPHEVKVGGKDCVCTTFIEMNSQTWDAYRKRSASREVKDDAQTWRCNSSSAYESRTSPQSPQLLLIKRQ
jgi:hypothetical protein